MIDRALRIIVIAILLLLTLGFGLCSALGLGVGVIGWIESLGKATDHHNQAGFTVIFLIVSVPGLLLAAALGWLTRRLTRDLRRGKPE